MGIPNFLCFLFLEFLGAGGHVLDDQKLFSRGMTSVKSTASYVS